MYDDLVGTFTQSGTVDEETQRNDIEVIRQILTRFISLRFVQKNGRQP